MRTQRTEVLVIGAGPVGLFSALQLTNADIDVTIIDRESGPAAHSYACVLHQSTLALLDQHGLIDEAIEVGQRIDTLGFYDEATRRAELRLSELHAAFPFLLVVPQSWLEEALERKLAEQGVDVRWNHRLDSLEPGPDEERAIIEQFGSTALGYVVPHWEQVVQKRFPIESSFIIAADGPESTARSCMNIDFETFGKPASFLIYEFETDRPLENEARIVMGPDSTDALWPLSETRCRWTFEMLPVNPHEFPPKDRESFVFTECDTDDNIRLCAQQAIRIRAPWFNNGVKEIIWRAPVDFQRHLVRSFGHNGRWLVGDAAHQTLPHTSQSMNAGLHEAKMLTDAIHRILRQNASTSLLDVYAEHTRETWKQLLDPETLTSHAAVDPWIARHSKNILSCLPATGDDLVRAAEQLHLQFANRPAALAHH